MKLFLLLSFQTLKSRPMRFVLSMLGIMIGVAGILALGISNQAALASIKSLFEQSSGKSDLMVTSASGEQGFSDTVLRKVANIAGIQTSAPLIKVSTILADQEQSQSLQFSFFGTTGKAMLLYGVDPGIDPKIRDYDITKGRFLDTTQSNFEIVLVQTFAEDEDIKLGDRVEILSPNGIEKFRVVGFISKTGAGQTNNGTFGVIDIESAQRAFNRNGVFDQLDILLQDSLKGNQVEEKRLDIQKRLGNDLDVTYPAGQGQRMNQMLSNYQIGLNFLSAIALFVGAFLIYNSFTMSIVERTHEYGMLRTIGMTKQQVIRAVLLESLLMGIIGSSLGLVVGILGARQLAGLLGNILGFNLTSQMTVPVGTLVLSFAVGIGVTVMSALIPALQAGKISPIAALRIRGVKKEGWFAKKSGLIGAALLIISSGLLIWNPIPNDPMFRVGSMTVILMFTGVTLIIPDTLPWWQRLSRGVMKKVYGSSGAIGNRNLERAKSRTTLTITALLVGVAMILVVRSMTASFAADLKLWINAYMGGDLYITSSVPLRSEVSRQLSGVNGVAAAAPVHYLNVEMQLPDKSTEKLTFMAVDPSTYTKATNFVFSDSRIDSQQALSKLSQSGAVFVSSVLSEKFGYQPGDFILLKTPAGLNAFEVAGVVVDFYNQGMVITGSWQDMRRLFRVDEISTILVKVRADSSIQSVSNSIEDLYGKRYRLSIESNTSVKESIFKLMDQAFVMFDLMAVMAVVVSSLGIINTLTMNVMERTREIGMLRAIGMTRKQVRRMILAEAGLMGIIGGLIGLVFGVFLSRIFLLGMTAMSGYKLDLIVPIGGVITGLVVSILISQLAALQPAQRANKTRILDAIHYE